MFSFVFLSFFLLFSLFIYKSSFHYFLFLIFIYFWLILTTNTNFINFLYFLLLFDWIRVDFLLIVIHFYCYFVDFIPIRSNCRSFPSIFYNFRSNRNEFSLIFDDLMQLALICYWNHTNWLLQTRFLRCFDSRGDHVYLPMDSRGKFSAVAKEDNISGVHKIANLLNKRLPLMVRMVSGKAPAGLKVGHQFTAEMRLLASFDEEIVVALPIASKANAVAIIPPTVSLKLQLPVNADVIKQSKEFLHVHDQCLHKYAQVADLIQVRSLLHSFIHSGSEKKSALKGSVCRGSNAH